jgi:hypothetical protein
MLGPTIRKGKIRLFLRCDRPYFRAAAPATASDLADNAHQATDKDDDDCPDDRENQAGGMNRRSIRWLGEQSGD